MSTSEQRDQAARLKLAATATRHVKDATEQRNYEIRQASFFGCTIKQVADATGLSTARIHQIIHGR